MALNRLDVYSLMGIIRMRFIIQSIDQYHKSIVQSPINRPISLWTIYISFLSLPSMQLCGEIIHNTQGTRILSQKLPSDLENKTLIPLQIVYFPLSHNPRINLIILNQLHQVFLEPDSELRNAEMKVIVMDAQSILDQKMELYRRSPLIQNPDPYIMNTVLFGEIAAQYLKVFYAFPVVIMNTIQITYHGIPNGMNPEQFVEFLLK